MSSITIGAIKRETAEHFHTKLIDMTSERRARSVARPRQVAMYLAYELTDRSYPVIGRAFGDRDHTTVMHAVRVIEELRSKDPAIAAAVTAIKDRLA